MPQQRIGVALRLQEVLGAQRFRRLAVRTAGLVVHHERTSARKLRVVGAQKVDLPFHERIGYRHEERHLGAPQPPLQRFGVRRAGEPARAGIGQPRALSRR